MVDTLGVLLIVLYRLTVSSTPLARRGNYPARSDTSVKGRHHTHAGLTWWLPSPCAFALDYDNNQPGLERQTERQKQTENRTTEKAEHYGPSSCSLSVFCRSFVPSICFSVCQTYLSAFLSCCLSVGVCVYFYSSEATPRRRRLLR